MITLFLILIFIVLGTIALSLFLKKKMMVFIVLGLILVGSFIIADQLKYKTFTELYSDQLHEKTVIKSVSITKYAGTGNIAEEADTVTIKDEEVIEEIVNDFSELELKRVDELHRFMRGYRIEFVVTNQVEEDHFSTSTIDLSVDQNNLNEYRILNNPNHLRTIQTLFQ